MTGKIKRKAMNIMITTGSAIMLLAVFAAVKGYETIYTHTLFEIFAANIVIHTGLILTKKFESSYAVLEYVLDVSYINAVNIAFGLVFDWFSSIPVWYLVVMAVAIYMFGVFINIVRTKKDADELNKLLQKRKNRDSTAVT